MFFEVKLVLAMFALSQCTEITIIETLGGVTTKGRGEIFPPKYITTYTTNTAYTCWLLLVVFICAPMGFRQIYMLDWIEVSRGSCENAIKANDCWDLG